MRKSISKNIPVFMHGISENMYQSPTPESPAVTAASGLSQGRDTCTGFISVTPVPGECGWVGRPPHYSGH